MRRMASVGGESIETMKSLGTAAIPHPLQETRIAEQIDHCNCSRGMLMVAPHCWQICPSRSADEWGVEKVRERQINRAIIQGFANETYANM